jgi:hypothetical protein
MFVKIMQKDGNTLTIAECIAAHVKPLDQEIVLTLKNSHMGPAGPDDITVYSLSPGDTAYFMNANGKTIDTYSYAYEEGKVTAQA